VRVMLCVQNGNKNDTFCTHNIIREDEDERMRIYLVCQKEQGHCL
jgi:hypothetical protein